MVSYMPTKMTASYKPSRMMDSLYGCHADDCIYKHCIHVYSY